MGTGPPRPLRRPEAAQPAKRPEIRLPTSRAAPAGAAADAAGADAGALPSLRLPERGGASGKRAAGRGPLIEELPEQQPSTGAPPPPPALVQPMCSVRRKDGVFTVTVEVPAASGAADVQLDITEQQLSLTGAGYALVLPFSERVVADAASAKFSQAKKRLTVTVPVAVQPA